MIVAETSKVERRAPLILGAFVIVSTIIVLIPRGSDSSGPLVAAANRKNMPEIAMHDLYGGNWRLSGHRGKVVLVNFWASWCGPCRHETPGIVRLANEYQSRGFEVAGVAMDDSDRPVRQFVTSYHVSYPVLLPPADSPYVSSISSLPTSFLVDKQGRMAKVYLEETSERELRADVDRLLAER